MIAVQYFCLVFSLCVHEAAHAAMANRCGDPSARLLGRLSLDPRRHVDPLGTVILPLLMMVTQVPLLFGWAKPVPFNPANLNDPRKDPVWIAVAGPLSNLFIAITAALLLRVVAVATGVVTDPTVLEPIIMLLFIMAMINSVLMVFNLLPFPPLDGHHVLRYFLPPAGKELLDRFAPFGIIAALLCVHYLNVLDPPLQGMMSLIQFIAFYNVPAA